MVVIFLTKVAQFVNKGKACVILFLFFILDWVAMGNVYRLLGELL